MGILQSSLPPALKLEVRAAKKLSSFFMSHVCLPVTDKENFILFMESIKNDMSLPIYMEFQDTAISIFQNGTLYMMQELVVFLILTMEAPWNDRLILLYECFRSQITDAVSHDDISVICQVSAISLLRAWKVQKLLPLETICEYAEAISDQVFVKLDLDLEASINRDPFIVFFVARFPEDKIIDNSELLLKFLENLYNV